MIYCGKKQERTEKDKRSVSMFSMACRLQDEQRYDEAIEAYWESIRLIDKDMRSTQSFVRSSILLSFP